MREICSDSIEWSTELWKYFKLEHFINCIETSSVYFASANQFDDEFEGAVAVQMNTMPPDSRYEEMEPTEKAFFQLKRLTKINCWHCASYESAAMWKLYAEQNKGIAVSTTPERMRRAFKPFRLRPEYGVEELWAGPVKYIDLTQVRMKGVNMLKRFFYKHRVFEWEQEFRLAISVRSAEEYGVQVPNKGIFVEVDLDVLVDRIILGSTISNDERNLVTMGLERLGLGDRLQISTLLGRPRYI